MEGNLTSGERAWRYMCDRRTQCKDKGSIQHIQHTDYGLIHIHSRYLGTGQRGGVYLNQRRGHEDRGLMRTHSVKTRALYSIYSTPTMGRYTYTVGTLTQGREGGYI